MKVGEAQDNEMSFRKRNVVVPSPGNLPLPLRSPEKAEIPGTRPSPVDGRLTTSTGTRSLDGLLAGHGGLAVGNSILIEESGTTDFGGALLRYYASEGLVQGHFVHVLGINELWVRDLPALSTTIDQRPTSTKGNAKPSEKMKIAWRYERLGEFGKDRVTGSSSSPLLNNYGQPPIFCHDFDLSKRLVLPNPSLLMCVPLSQQADYSLKSKEVSSSPFDGILDHLTAQVSAASPSTIHRVVIPNFLSPAIYPHNASTPEHVLQFLHSLRALLRTYPSQVTVLITFPLSLYPRTLGLTRWTELLSDGVLEIVPFPSNPTSAHGPTSGITQDESPQGMLKVHRLPVFHEKGGGGVEVEDDLAFYLSRRRGLVIKPFSLPPVDGELGEHQEGLESEHGKATRLDIDF